MRTELTIFFGLLLLLQSQALKWLLMKNVGYCNDGYLISKQKQFCIQHKSFMPFLYQGAKQSLDECQFQFRSKRWNCSFINKRGTRSSNNTTKKKGKNKKLFIVPSGTRESSFLHAISSAGVAYSITKSCSGGNSPECGCDRSIERSRNGDKMHMFKWAGCSDNIDYGVSLSRGFVDVKDHRMSRKNKNKTVSLVNLHNNEVGRMIITQNMRINCKCHGVSGSCEVKSCWRVMPSFREIGEIVRQKFELSMQVEEKPTDKGTRRRLVTKSGHPVDTNSVDLVYLRKSPDYCTENLKRGSLGTKGRKCSQNPNSPNSCQHLCCNRKVSTTIIKKVERCRCKFEWCCEVKCEKCVVVSEQSYCE